VATALTLAHTRMTVSLVAARRVGVSSALTDPKTRTADSTRPVYPLVNLAAVVARAGPIASTESTAHSNLPTPRGVGVCVSQPRGGLAQGRARMLTTA